MRTDAQKRAESAYRKKVKQIVVRFSLTDEDKALYEWITKHGNVTEYIKNLVRKDMQNTR